jgi:hypothetical protein
MKLFLPHWTSAGPRRGLDNFMGGGVVIHVRFGHGVDPYFDIIMPRSMKGWWKSGFA